MLRTGQWTEFKLFLYFLGLLAVAVQRWRRVHALEPALRHQRGPAERRGALLLQSETQHKLKAQLPSHGLYPHRHPATTPGIFCGGTPPPPAIASPVEMRMASLLVAMLFTCELVTDPLTLLRGAKLGSLRSRHLKSTSLCKFLSPAFLTAWAEHPLLSESERSTMPEFASFARDDDTIDSEDIVSGTSLRDKEGKEANAKRLGVQKTVEHKLPMEVLNAPKLPALRQGGQRSQGQEFRDIPPRKNKRVALTKSAFVNFSTPMKR
ncbi:hypothetical protein BCR34DRAFT_598947 [Clohesyomyces aquaticus]|uniref:Uncharacterized protein n=1 Tax=Clohesyomyces aquaticus TaxID=1231657 RepID=A0A1Y1ZXN0_9PLEO|nr:hypothetical protein BCR34DRAFT_598947 [Clohesyomyces aquaticus]